MAGRLIAAISLGLAAAASLPARAAPGGELGDVIPIVELKALDGKKVAIASRKATANVLIFFRTDQEHSADALKAMAECEKEFAAKPVNWVAVVSDSEPTDAVKQLVA